MVLAEDGYYYQERGDRTPYFFGSDDLFHPLIQIQDTTGTLRHKPEVVNTFLGLMIQHNNSFTNYAGEVVEFTRAIVITELHKSTATGDPYSNLGVPHFGIQLTNDSLFAQDGSTHLYHFRPDQPELSTFYDEAQTRTEVTKQQNKRYAMRHGKGNKKDPPGGGAGASSRSSKGGSSKEASSKGSSSKGTSAKGGSSKVTSSGGSSSKRHTSNSGSTLETPPEISTKRALNRECRQLIPYLQSVCT